MIHLCSFFCRFMWRDHFQAYLTVSIPGAFGRFVRLKSPHSVYLIRSTQYYKERYIISIFPLFCKPLPRESPITNETNDRNKAKNRWKSTKKKNRDFAVVDVWNNTVKLVSMTKEKLQWKPVYRHKLVVSFTRTTPRAASSIAWAPIHTRTQITSRAGPIKKMNNTNLRKLAIVHGQCCRHNVQLTRNNNILIFEPRHAFSLFYPFPTRVCVCAFCEHLLSGYLLASWSGTSLRHLLPSSTQWYSLTFCVPLHSHPSKLSLSLTHWFWLRQMEIYFVRIWFAIRYGHYPLHL